MTQPTPGNRPNANTKSPWNNPAFSEPTSGAALTEGSPPP